MNKLAKTIVIGLLLVTTCVAVLYILGKEIKKKGEADTEWLRLEIWPSQYFNPENLALNEADRIYIKSVKPHNKNKQALLRTLKSKQCHEINDECLTILLAVANILIDEGETDKALTLENQAARDIYQAKICPIKLETTLIKHALRTLKNSSPSTARSKAKLIIETIKKNKGINSNLQTPECNISATKTPLLFHTYIMSVADVMSYGDSSLIKSAAYLRNTNRIKFEGL